MSIALLIRDWDTKWWQEAMGRLAPDRGFQTAPDIAAPEDVKYALCWKPHPGLLATLPNLEVVYSLGAGVDHIFVEPHLPDVPVVRIIDPDLAVRMSEYVVLHVLMHHRKQRAYDWFQREKKWIDLPQAVASEMRVGVMGLGILGQDAAEKLKMMGFQVNGWARSEKNIDGIRCFHGGAGLNPFLNETDILVCLLPHTPDTDRILNMAVFRELSHEGPLEKPVIINCGRGGLQNEADIIKALDDGVLGAATLDVFEVEPLPDSSPLWAHPGVTVTPHNSSASHPDTILRNVLEQIAKYESGEPLENVVDPKRGY